MCKSEQSDPKRDERESQAARIQQMKTTNLTENSLMKTVNKMKSTYKKADQPYQYMMFYPLTALAGFYRTQGNTKQYAETLMQIFEARKDTDFSVSCAVIVEVIKTYMQARMDEEAKVAFQTAKEYLVGPIEIYNYAYNSNGLNSFK